MQNIHSIKREKENLFFFCFQIEKKYSQNAFDRVGLIVIAIAILARLKFLPCCVCLYFSLEKKVYFSFPFLVFEKLSLFYTCIYKNHAAREALFYSPFVVSHPTPFVFLLYSCFCPYTLYVHCLSQYECASFFFLFNSIIRSLSIPCIRLSSLLFTSIRFLS